MIFEAHPRSILIAPDKFKGSLSAIGVTAAVARVSAGSFPLPRAGRTRQLLIPPG